jgi:Ca2+-dependent lipid-binding protein
MTRSTDFFTKMDPYVVVKIGGHTKKTRTHKNGGKNPEWSDILEFDVKGDICAELTVMDEDLGKDDHVGSGTYNLEKVFQKGTHKEHIEMRHKGKVVGKVWIEFNFMDSGSKAVHGTVASIINQYIAPPPPSFAPSYAPPAPAPGMTYAP